MKLNRIIKFIRFNKIFWGVFLAIVLMNLAFHMTIGRYQRHSVDDLRNTYQKMRSAKLPQEDNSQDKFLKARQDVQYFIEQLLPRTEFSTMVGEVFKALQSHGLSVNKMSYNPETIDVYNILKLTTSFTVNGKYESLKALLADLQESKTLFSIEGLTFSNRSTENESVDMTVRIATYFR